MKKVIYSILLGFLFSSCFIHSVTRYAYCYTCECPKGYTKVSIEGRLFGGRTCEFYACANPKAIRCVLSRDKGLQCWVASTKSNQTLRSPLPTSCQSLLKQTQNTGANQPIWSDNINESSPPTGATTSPQIPSEKP